MLTRFWLSAFSLLAVCATADALPIMRPHSPSAIVEVRSLRVPCRCRMTRVAVRPVQKRTVIVGLSVSSREERRPRNRSYDMPAIPKRK